MNGQKKRSRANCTTLSAPRCLIYLCLMLIVCCYRPPNSDEINALRSLAENVMTMTAVHECIPSKLVDPRRSPPWITSNILHQIRKKFTARKRYLRKSTEYLRVKFSKLRSEVKKAIQRSRESFFSSLGNTLYVNPKRFWTVFQLKSSSGSIPGSVSSSDSNHSESRIHANTPNDIATLFNKYFHSVYTCFPDQSTAPQAGSSSPVSSISSIDLSVEEVYEALQNLDPSKAHGPDGLPSRILKECSSQLAPSLHRLFTKSLRLSQIPAEWKLANIIPLHKKGNREFVENYRPISLLSVVIKVLSAVSSTMYRTIFIPTSTRHSTALSTENLAQHNCYPF